MNKRQAVIDAAIALCKNMDEVEAIDSKWGSQLYDLGLAVQDLETERPEEWNTMRVVVEVCSIGLREKDLRWEVEKLLAPLRNNLTTYGCRLAGSPKVKAFSKFISKV